MKINTMRALFAAWIFFATPAAAYELTDNPAFCFGFLSAQSSSEASTLLKRKRYIRSLFAKMGPRDPTDGRGFKEWQKIGRDFAFQRADGKRKTHLKNCRKLLGR